MVAGSLDGASVVEGALAVDAVTEGALAVDAINEGALAVDAVELTGVFGPGGLTRAGLVGVVILALGGGLLWRDASFLDRSASAAMERPVSSVLYGVAAHLTIAFAGVTLTAKLGRVDAGGLFLGWIGVVFGVGLLLVTAMLGFSVVGTILVGALGRESRSLGVLLGAAIAAAITLVDPLVAVATWLVLVSAGIGGATRRWFNADAVPSV